MECKVIGYDGSEQMVECNSISTPTFKPHNVQVIDMNGEVGNVMGHPHWLPVILDAPQETYDIIQLNSPCELQFDKWNLLGVYIRADSEGSVKRLHVRAAYLVK